MNGDSFGNQNTFLLKKRVLASDRARRPQRELLKVICDCFYMKYIIGLFCVIKGFIFLFLGLNRRVFPAYFGFIGLISGFCRFLGV